MERRQIKQKRDSIKSELHEKKRERIQKKRGYIWKELHGKAITRKSDKTW